MQRNTGLTRMLVNLIIRKRTVSGNSSISTRIPELDTTACYWIFQKIGCPGYPYGSYVHLKTISLSWRMVKGVFPVVV
jgi:hypothetical protein